MVSGQVLSYGFGEGIFEASVMIEHVHQSNYRLKPTSGVGSFAGATIARSKRYRC